MDEKHDKADKTKDKQVYPVVGAPVDPKGEKQRGSSRASRRLEDIESRLSKSVHRVAKAAEKGVSTYIDKRDQSARRERDGALVDFYENVAEGVSEAIAESSPVLTDFAKALNTKRLRKRIRRTIAGIPMLT
jgi:hypothetical protein